MNHRCKAGINELGTKWCLAHDMVWDHAMTDQPLPLKPSNDLDADLRKLGYVPEVIALKGDVFARVCYEREELKDKLALAQAIVERQRVHLSQHLEHKEWLKAKIQEQAAQLEALTEALEFYGDLMNWEDTGCSSGCHSIPDHNDKAKSALDRVKGK